MKYLFLAIDGGAKVKAHIDRPGKRFVPALVLVLSLLSTSAVFAQGSIFGSVTNSNLTVPANGEISFFGYLDDTDEEIRIETSVGAGYDAGNWYDDFQNYLTEAPGNPYDYHFFNIANGQGYVLSKLIPNNSFQQEDIALTPVSWPATVTGLSGQAISSSAVKIRWNGVPGITYHIYRRLASSSGSFFRIDDPSGSLSNPGVADSFFIDTGADGMSDYHYIVIAEDISGNLSRHSDILAVSASAVQPPIVNAITPDSGYTVGGTSITIIGDNFDMAGATATIGGASVTSVVVVSPFEITGLTPPGTVGPADVYVTNLASGMGSVPLSGGFTYQANNPPVLDPIGPQSVAEGGNLNVIVTSSDPDGTIPALSTSTLPSNATFLDNGDGSGTFDFNPDFTQEGSYPVTFYASDGIATDSEAVTITVTGTNQDPVLDPIGPQSVAEGANLNLNITASDLDGTIPTLTTSALPPNATFLDNGDGSGTFDFNPDFTQEGSYPVTFYASDGIATDSEAVTITVTGTNQDPVLDPIGPQSVAEGGNLNLIITASDPDGTIPTLSTSTLPANATFLDNGDGSGTFDFNPDLTQEGIYPVTFYAADGIATDSEVVTITVTGTNQDPVLDPIGPQSVAEGANLNVVITASDPDATIPTLTTSTLPTNATFLDNGDGSGTFDFNPDFTQEGSYPVTFYASDGIATDSEAVTITVTHTNQPPVLDSIGPQLVDEGSNLNFVVTSSDGDGTIPALSTSTLPANATFLDNGDGSGTFDFNPDFTQGGIYNITFYAGDGIETDSETVVVTVNELGNQSPVLDSIGPQVVDENANLNVTITASDPDGDVPILTAENIPFNATFVDNLDGSGVFDFNPDYTQSGVFNVTFIASDSFLTDTEVVAITVNDVNRLPVLDSIGPHVVTEGANLNFTVTASDPDGTIPALSTSTLPANATFLDNGDGSGVFDFNPDFTQSGPYDITFYADDGIDTVSELVTITVNEVGNQAPVLTPIGTQVVYETVNLNLIITAIDPDGDSLTLSASNLPTGATFVDNLDGTGVFDFTPDYDQSGDYDVTFKAFDGILVDSEVVVVSVLNTNRDPVLDPIGPQTMTEGDTLNLIITSSDADGDIPVLSTTTLPANAAFLDNLDGTGTFDFTPDFTQEGIYPITFYASDGVSTDSEQVSITVGDAGNQPPVLDSIGSRIVSEGATLIIDVTATDPDGLIPTLSAINLPTNATFGDSLNGTGRFEFTPDFTQAGVYGVTFIADDGILADSEYVMITVEELGNQAPILDSIGPQTVYENDTLILNLSATDPEGHNIVFSYVPNSPINGITLVDNFDGTAVLTYLPDFYSAGVDTIRVFATDDGNPPLSGVEVVEIVTIDLNQPPQIDSLGPFAVKSGRILQFTVTASDSTASDGSSLYLSASGLPANATFVDNGDGTGLFSFAPVITQVGVYTVRFTVIDDGTPAMSSYIDVEITVVASNQPPELAYIGPQMVVEDQTLTIVATATDPDGTIPTLSVENLPENAFFEDSLNGVGVFTFTPSFVQSGLYGVTFRATDGIDVDKEIVLIQVIDAGNQAPVLAPIGPKGVTETLTLAFSISASDPDETTPHLVADSLPSGATLNDNGDGTANFLWVPGYTDQGQYNVYFMAYDGELSDTEVVVITVDDIGNQTPVINPVNDTTVNELDLVHFTVTASDLDMVPPILSAAPLPGSATFTDNQNFTGTFDWLTGYDDEGEYDITFYAVDADDAGIVDSFAMRITIINTNRLPIIYEFPPGQETTVDEGDTLVFTVEASDPDGDPPIILMDRTIENFNLVDDGNGNGTLTITPHYQQAGLYQIIFIAKDGDSANYPNDSSVMIPKNFIINDIPVPPVLDSIGPQTITEGETLMLGITAYSPGGGSVDIFAENMPENSSLFGFGDAKQFSFTPSYIQAGAYDVLFYASVEILGNIMADSETVTITVTEAGNQPPYFEQNFPDTQIIAYGDSVLNHIISADPDLDPVTLSIINPPANTIFVDSGNGNGSLKFTPDNTQVWAIFSFRIVATDPMAAADTMFKWVRVVAFMRGDANSDDEVNLADVSYLVDYIFRGGDPPVLMEAADANFDEQVDVSDALYLINYIFRHGPPPPQ